MKTTNNCLESEISFHPSCIKLTEKAVETLNDLQAGGTLLTKLHTDKDFNDCGIDDTIKTMNEITDFIFSMYLWKLDGMEGSAKDAFVYQVFDNLNKIYSIKFIFDSLRSNPKPTTLEN